MSKPPKNHRAILVGTETKGLFFGYVPIDGPTNEEIFGGIVSLKQARMCVYWPPGTGGAFGLASAGPKHGCRIGPRANATVGPVAGVLDVEGNALALWEAFSWEP